MKGWSLVLGYFVINAAIWTINMAGILTNWSRAPIMDPSNLGTIFSLDAFTVVTGLVGGGVVTVLALITKSYALSTGVLIMWIVGVLITPLRDVVVGLPMLLNAILPSGLWFVTSVISGFCAMILFLFVVGVIAGREIF